jgi:hypothetical protein
MSIRAQAGQKHLKMIGAAKVSPSIPSDKGF